MFGLHGVSVPGALEPGLRSLFADGLGSAVAFRGFTPATEIEPSRAFATIAFGLTIVWLSPNVRQLFTRFHPTWEDIAGVKTPSGNIRSRLLARAEWAPTDARAFALGILFFACLLLVASNRTSEFLYFQF
jgi:hypothetical protein